MNERILRNAHSGVKKLPVKEPTKPVGFDLETVKRTDVWESRKPDEEEVQTFHARPVPTAIFKGPTVSHKKHINLLSVKSQWTYGPALLPWSIHLLTALSWLLKVYFAQKICKGGASASNIL